MQHLPTLCSLRRASIAAILACLAIGTPALAAKPTFRSGPEPVLNGLQRGDAAFKPHVALRGSTALGVFNPRMFDAAEVSVAMPDGRVLRAQRQHFVEHPSRSAKSWVGTFAEQPGSLATFSTVRGVTTGFVSYGTETWEILPERAGMHLMYRVDPRKLPSVELEDAHPYVADADVASAAARAGADATATAAGNHVIDLLVVYTPAARANYGQATLASMIQNGIAMANQAYANSRIAITLNLVGLQEISYVEGDVQLALDDLRGTSDGKMDSVHTLRNTVGADVVTLVTQSTNACGMASVMTTVSNAFAPMAFNVVKAGCLSQHSLAHEIGHNMGNKHDRANADDAGAYPYSYGYRRCTSDGTGFRTVMAYACTGAPRVAWFSSPNAYYNGYPTGVAHESDPANSADNARSMTNTAATVAAFRASSGSPPPPAPLPTAPTGLTAAAASSSSISLRWTDTASNETGYLVERSTNGTTYTQVATLGAGTISYTSTGLAAATTYQHRVRAYNGSGNSAYSNVASATTSALSGTTTSVPVNPSNVVAVNRTGGSARVTWTDNSTNETYFQVLRQKWLPSKSAWGSGTVVAKPGTNSVAYTDTPGAGKFRYKVLAGNAAGISAYATSASVTVTN